jgi:hypothetical protein
VFLWLRIAGGVLLPTLASAQASISGLVQDSSGAVLPGVTVEASSPALIEKTRSAVTDGSGRYSIVDFRPGTYSVTFSLNGFNTVRRDGIVLQGTFDAQVNTDLRVGTVQETVTVSGASPVVDVKNNITQTVLTKEQIEILPGDRTLKGRAALIPGVVIPGANTGVVAHGSDSQDSHTMIDGFKSGQHLVGRGTGQLGVGSVTQTQEATIEELVYITDSQGAEYAFSGVRMNMIPKEGVIHSDGGAFVQDQWKLDRFTINLGLRWDHFNAGIPQQTNPASNFTPAIVMPGDKNDVPNFDDWATRTGDSASVQHFRQRQLSSVRRARLRLVPGPAVLCRSAAGHGCGDRGRSDTGKHDLRQSSSAECDVSGLLEDRGRAVRQDHDDGETADHGAGGVQQCLQHPQHQLGDAELRLELAAARDSSARTERSIRAADALLARPAAPGKRRPILAAASRRSRLPHNGAGRSRWRDLRSFRRYRFAINC